MNNQFQQELIKLFSNKRQKEAFSYDDNCVVQAGPGSGKTATLTLKIMKLLTEKIQPPRGLACLTYNNEAVREFQNRLKILGIPDRPNVFLGTVHSFCLSQVIKPFSKFYRKDLPSPLIVAPDKECKRIFGTITTMDKLEFDRYRRTKIYRNTQAWNEDIQCANSIVAYENKLREAGYIDFDDLILISLNLIESYPFIGKCLSAKFPWFVIDEYQDLGYPLHHIVLSLLKNAGIKVFAVGDPDQSIYGFTGADPKYLQELASRKDFTSVKLDLNYRCGQKIINAAEVVLSPPSPRNYKASRGNSNQGEVYFLEKPNGLEEQIDYIISGILPELFKNNYSPKEIAILYIDKNDAEVIVSKLDTAGIKYAGVKDKRYERTPLTRWIENIAEWCCGGTIRFEELSNFWLGMLSNAGQSINDSQILSCKKNLLSTLIKLKNPDILLKDWLCQLVQGLSLKDVISKLKDRPSEIDSLREMYSACQEGKALYNYTLTDFIGCGANSNVISLNTLHSSKGLQYDVVIIPGLEEGRLPSWGAKTNEAIKEARRTFYVGFTRARQIVFLLYSGWYFTKTKYGNKKFKNGVSRFVLELKQNLSTPDDNAKESNET